MIKHHLYFSREPSRNLGSRSALLPGSQLREAGDGFIATGEKKEGCEKHADKGKSVNWERRGFSSDTSKDAWMKSNCVKFKYRLSETSVPVLA